MVEPSDNARRDVGDGIKQVQRHAQGKYAGEKDSAKQLSDKDPAAAKKSHHKKAQKNGTEKHTFPKVRQWKP